MKQYSFLQEFTLPEVAVVATGAGAVSGLLASKKKYISKLMDKFQKTGDDKYKIKANQIEAMSLLKFKSIMAAKRAGIGLGATAALGAGLYAKDALMKDNRESKKIDDNWNKLVDQVKNDEKLRNHETVKWPPAGYEFKR